MKIRQYSPVARSYAEALFRSAKKLGNLAQVREELAALAELGDAGRKLRIFLTGPQFSTEAKLALIEKTLGASVSKNLRKMLELLVRRERYGEFDSIWERFEELCEQDEGVYSAVVTTARALGSDERQELQASLEKYAECRLKITFEVNPDVIGGVIFRFRDTLIDSSLRSGLERVRRQLKNAQITQQPAA